MSIHDLIQSLIKQRGPCANIKLQHLAYYCQAWSLVLNNKLMFREHILACDNRILIPAIDELCNQDFYVKEWGLGKLKIWPTEQQETINKVIEFYSHLTSQQLIHLARSERVWKITRELKVHNSWGDPIVTPKLLKSYYSSLLAKDETA